MTTHGLARHGNRHPLYGTWHSMNTRCRNPRDVRYQRYGGRGITVCERWSGAEGFPHFILDMGPKPGPEYSIDRIDNDGPYSPENCRWATAKEQSNNRRPPPRATHCKRGHPLEGANLKVNKKTGERACRTCAIARSREFRARKRAARV